MGHLVVVAPRMVERSGIADYANALSLALAGSGHFDKVTMLSARSPGPRSAGMGLRLEPTWNHGSPISGWHVLRKVTQLRPDVVWFNLGLGSYGAGPFSNGGIAMAAPTLGKLGYPVVVTLHDLPSPEDLPLLGVRIPGVSRAIDFYLRQLGGADVSVCVLLERTARRLQRVSPGLEPIVIPHGVLDGAGSLTLPTERRILCFGALAPYKGIELLLDAHEDVRRLAPDVTLTVAGCEHPRFQGYSSRLQGQRQRRDSVCWRMNVPSADLAELFTAAAVVVVPSTAGTGASSVVYRAASWGRAMILADLPDLRATVDEIGLEATFFQPGSRNDLSKALHRVLSDPTSQRRQVERNLKAVRPTSSTDTLDAYVRLFMAATTGRLARSPSPGGEGQRPTTRLPGDMTAKKNSSGTAAEI